MKSTRWIILTMALLIYGCASNRGGPSHETNREALMPLASSTRPLQDQFNSDKSRLRVIEDGRDGHTGVIWKNGADQPPVETDWFVELREAMRTMTGKEP